MKLKITGPLLVAALIRASAHQFPIQGGSHLNLAITDNHVAPIANKEHFLDKLIADMTIEDLGQLLYMIECH